MSSEEKSEWIGSLKIASQGYRQHQKTANKPILKAKPKNKSWKRQKSASKIGFLAGRYAA